MSTNKIKRFLKWLLLIAVWQILAILLLFLLVQCAYYVEARPHIVISDFLFACCWHHKAPSLWFVGVLYVFAMLFVGGLMYLIAKKQNKK
ncbi:MAG: hypothetical protein FWC39_02155 [Bacteroidetes bacterium]|nr:hypothetical protein [Bacteroidota bacterium]